MNLIETLKKAGYPNTGTPVIAFFGDSVTHGAFECIVCEGANCIFDFDAVYHARLRRMLLEVNSWLPVSMINAGVAGDNAPMGLARLDRDVIAHKPDICVVNFGLNDIGDPLETYTAAMAEIFDRLQAAGIRVILLTPNLINSYVHEDTAAIFKEYAAVTAARYAEGRMDTYIDAARALARERGIPVADAYARWKQMAAEGKDITACLANYINHPTREMHAIFAEELFKVLDGEV